MSDYTTKCVLLQGLPFDLEETDVLNILESKGFHDGVEKIEARVEKPDDKRWIVLFKTEEDATNCLVQGQWKTTLRGETVQVVPDFCSEYIIPENWASVVGSLMQQQDDQASRKTPMPDEMAGPGLFSEVNDHKTPFPQKKEDRNQANDGVIQNNLTQLPRKDKGISEDINKPTDVSSQTDEKTETGAKIEQVVEKKPADRCTRMDPAEIPHTLGTKPTAKYEEENEEITEDREIINKRAEQMRNLSPVSSTDETSLNVPVRQSSWITTGDSLDEAFILRPKEPTNDDDKTLNRSKITEVKQTSNKIMVTGFKESSSLESIRMFFENKQKSGGDKTVSSELLKDPDALVIEFQDSSVVESVLQKQEESCLRLDELVLKARPYIPPPIDEYRLFLSGVKEGVSRARLEMFVEVVSGLCPISIESGETPGTFMLIFEEVPDFDRLRQTLTHRTLEDGIVTVSQVKKSSSIQVSGYGSVTPETLEHYFGNQKISGGGEVDYIRTEKTRSIIQFRYLEDASRVCDGRSHPLEGRKLHVCMYHKCMDLNTNVGIKIPEPLILRDVNSSIIKFLHGSSKYKDKLAIELETAFGLLDWASSGEKDLVISCTLDPKQRESIQKFKEWKPKCNEVVNRFLDTLDVNEDIVVQEEVWQRSLGVLDDVVSNQNPDDILVFVKSKEHKIEVCGEKRIVAAFSEKIGGMFEDIEKKEIMKSQEIRKTVMLKEYQIALLNTVDFFNPNNYSTTKLTVENKSSGEVIFSGQKCTIDQTISTMKKKLKGFFKQSFIPDKLMKKLLFEKRVRDYIEKQIMKEKKMGVLNVIKGDDIIYMYSKTEKQSQAAIAIAKKCLVQKIVPLDIEMEDQLYGHSGKNALSQLLEEHQGLLNFEKSTGQLVIITVDNLIDKVYKQVKEFLDLHTVTEEFVHVSSGRLNFINQFLLDRIDDIENNNKNLFVIIKQEATQFRHGFKVKGQRHGCKDAIKQLNKLKEDVYTEEHCIESFDINLKEFFSSITGRDKLSDIETNEKCVLKIKPDRSTAEITDKQDTLTARAECTVNNCKIMVMEGDMTELHDRVDVLVTSRNLNMSNKGDLSGAVINKGGFDIEKECESYLKQHDVNYGDVVVTGSGKLQCKHIFHAISPEWQGGHKNEEKLLQKTVKNCFDKMTKTKLRSIALPALSTKFPLQKALMNIVDVLYDFVKEPYSVEEINLCGFKDEIITGFITELKRKFTDVKEMGSSNLNHQEYEEERRSDNLAKVVIKRQRGSSKSYYQARKIKIDVVKDELYRQKIDVIVNSTNQTLDLKVGHTSKSLLEIGGESIQQDLQRKYPEGIQMDDIAISTGGNLKCIEIYHGILVKYEEGRWKSEKKMEMLVKNCLKLADERHRHSIAFPALGTGMLGFPADLVAGLFYKTVKEYEIENPNTGLNGVLLVVHPTDTSTFQAFNDEKRRSEELTKRIGGISPFAGTYSMTPADLNTGHKFYIGPVTVDIMEGDITKETTDIVVNSTIKELILSSGAVSKAILGAAGSSLQSECHSAENRAKMKANGYIITSPGNMMCGKILHIKARSTSSKWEQTVRNCLKVVEDDGSSSLSFPALGTGGKGCSPENVAKAMITAFRSYIQSSDYKSTLKTIRIVIYQADMVNSFVAASKEDSNRNLKRGHKFYIGPVIVDILQGDITKETTDIVVNSTRENLNLSSGAVSKAILDAAGVSLQRECYSADNQGKMKINGYIITKPGKMKCRKILHIKARGSSSNWEKTVRSCLQLVENDGSSSVSFPALGTGGKGCSPDSVAKAMMSGFRSYIQSSDYTFTLKSIRIIIYKAAMVKAFVDASQDDSKSLWKFIDRFKPKQEPSKIVFCIFTDTPSRVNKVKSLLDDIVSEEALHQKTQISDDQVYGTMIKRYTPKLVSESLYQFYNKDKTSRADGKNNGKQRDKMSTDQSLVSPVDDYAENKDKKTPKIEMFVMKGKVLRALWKEMPEVKASGVLDNISDSERKLQEAMFEIITSEATYLKSLNVLIKVFLKSKELGSNLAAERVLTPKERRIIFSNIGSIREASERFLSDLESRWQESVLISDVCDIITKHAAEKFECYIHYCSNQMFQLRAVTNLSKKQDFAEALKKLESNPECQGLSTQSFLMLPMQRITRFPLLVRAILDRLNPTKDNKRYNSAIDALSAVETVVKQCNDGAKKLAQREEMDLIAKQLDFQNVDMTQKSLLLSSRYLVKQGELTRIVIDSGGLPGLPLGKAKAGKQSTYAFLFNNILLMTMKKGSQYVVTDYSMRSSIYVEPLDSQEMLNQYLPLGVPSGCENLFLFVMLENYEKKRIEYVFSCNTTSDRERWMDAVTSVKITDGNERIYEDWDCPHVECVKKYVPKEADELALEESDFVRVYKKLPDGMYEGERVRDDERGWFPKENVVEVENAHVRARIQRQIYASFMQTM